MTWIIDYEELKRIATAEEDDSIIGNLYEKNEILRGYKRAFLQPGVLNAIFHVLLRPIQVEYRVRTTRDTAIIRLGLSLFRNLVAIRDAETSLTGSMDQFLSSIMQVREAAYEEANRHRITPVELPGIGGASNVRIPSLSYFLLLF